VKKIANTLDFGDFRQIILYFGLSVWTRNNSISAI